MPTLPAQNIVDRMIYIEQQLPPYNFSNICSGCYLMHVCDVVDYLSTGTKKLMVANIYII
jgi:hypothetical protein